MSDLIPFANGEFELSIQMHEVDGFRVQAPGLARALGFREAFDLLRSIPDAEKGSEPVRTPGGEQRVGYLTEAGFYRALGQRQSARISDATTRAAVARFQSWVYGEVLPAIRKTGSYGAAPALPDMSTPEGQLQVIDAWRSSVQKTIEQAAEIKALTPKANYVDSFVSAVGDATTIRVLSNQLGVQEKTLRDHLVQHKVIYRKVEGSRWSRSQGKQITEYSWHAYAKYSDWFTERDQPEAPRLHNDQVRTTLYVTPVGKVKVGELLRRTLPGGAA